MRGAQPAAEADIKHVRADLLTKVAAGNANGMSIRLACSDKYRRNPLDVTCTARTAGQLPDTMKAMTQPSWTASSAPAGWDTCFTAHSGSTNRISGLASTQFSRLDQVSPDPHSGRSVACKHYQATGSVSLRSPAGNH